MLTTEVIYKKDGMLNTLLQSFGFHLNNGEYSLALPTTKRKLKLIPYQDKKTLKLTFPENVSMKDCQIIYEIIYTLSEELQGNVKDENALLGYDNAGQKVFIYHGFPNWSDYINEAKHKSLEGQMVSVSHGEEILGEGMLLTYDKKEDTSNGTIFISCDILTKSGEQSFFGENIEVTPITQW
ncbi:hypothetical protein J2S74_002807 [Evansella vedderi]|uniref:Uncharacterized protein n=1 Tax=Evansella vedderi TaxID=38282 RepID=A0ABT9ZWU1_9BACI|nr:hypothetical protein [Evansella vedderi]MDQ0255425.1 hypothetical protein [Evansella vedderi]